MCWMQRWSFDFLVLGGTVKQSCRALYVEIVRAHVGSKLGCPFRSETCPAVQGRVGESKSLAARDPKPQPRGAAVVQPQSGAAQEAVLHPAAPSPPVLHAP